MTDGFLGESVVVVVVVVGSVLTVVDVVHSVAFYLKIGLCASSFEVFNNSGSFDAPHGVCHFFPLFRCIHFRLTCAGIAIGTAGMVPETVPLPVLSIVLPISHLIEVAVAVTRVSLGPA
jgi:hypothetical protein